MSCFGSIRFKFISYFQEVIIFRLLLFVVMCGVCVSVTYASENNSFMNDTYLQVQGQSGLVFTPSISVGIGISQPEFPLEVSNNIVFSSEFNSDSWFNYFDMKFYYIRSSGGQDLADKQFFLFHDDHLNTSSGSGVSFFRLIRSDFSVEESGTYDIASFGTIEEAALLSLYNNVSDGKFGVLIGFDDISGDFSESSDYFQNFLNKGLTHFATVTPSVTNVPQLAIFLGGTQSTTNTAQSVASFAAAEGYWRPQLAGWFINGMFTASGMTTPVLTDSLWNIPTFRATEFDLLHYRETYVEPAVAFLVNNQNQGPGIGIDETSFIAKGGIRLFPSDDGLTQLTLYNNDQQAYIRHTGTSSDSELWFGIADDWDSNSTVNDLAFISTYFADNHQNRVFWFEGNGTAYALGSFNNGFSDYAEWIERDSESMPGDLIGLHLATGRVRTFQAGDIFIGVYSKYPAFLANQPVDDDDGEQRRHSHTPVGLVGQLDVDMDQVVIRQRLVFTHDGQYVGVLLANGKVLVNR